MQRSSQAVRSRLWRQLTLVSGKWDVSVTVMKVLEVSPERPTRGQLCRVWRQDLGPWISETHPWSPLLIDRKLRTPLISTGLPGWNIGKKSLPTSAGDVGGPGWILGSGGSPGGRNGSSILAWRSLAAQSTGKGWAGAGGRVAKNRRRLEHAGVHLLGLNLVVQWLKAPCSQCRGLRFHV